MQREHGKCVDLAEAERKFQGISAHSNFEVDSNSQMSPGRQIPHEQKVFASVYYGPGLHRWKRAHPIVLDPVICEEL